MGEKSSPSGMTVAGMVCMSSSPFPAVTRNSKGPELQKAQFLRLYKRQLVTLTNLLSIRSQSLIAPTPQPLPAAAESTHHGIRHHASSHRISSRQQSPLWNHSRITLQQAASRHHSRTSLESGLQQAAVTIGSRIQTPAGSSHRRITGDAPAQPSPPATMASPSPPPSSDGDEVR
jgi:hypothetical protein